MITLTSITNEIPLYASASLQVYEKSESASTAVNNMLEDANRRIRDFDADHPQFNATWLLVITWFEIPSFTTTANVSVLQ